MADPQSAADERPAADSIEWRALHPTSSRVRWLVALLAGLVFGGGATVAAVAILNVSDLSRVAVAATLLVATVPAGVGLGWYRSARERTPLADAVAIDAAGTVWLPVAGAIAAASVLAVPWLGDAAVARLAMVAATAGAAGLLLVQHLRCTGRIDPESATATVEGRLYDLERAPTTPIHLGSVTVVVIQRPARDPIARYDAFAMPTSVYRRAARATAGPGL